MEEILRTAMSPDEEMVNLIERAYLEGQIDGKVAAQAMAWLEANSPRSQ
jgi:hypothetical protein